MILEFSSAPSSAVELPSEADRQLGFIAAVTGRLRSISPHVAIQRRKSPSVRTPWRMPLSDTTKISLDWLAVILLSAERMLSSAKTTNWVKLRSIRMPFTVLALTPRVQSSADITPDLDTTGSAQSFAARGFGTTRLRRDALPLGVVGAFVRPE